MPKFTWLRRDATIDGAAEHPARELHSAVFRYWKRHQALRIIAGVIVAWTIGSVGLHFAEGRTSAEFRTWGSSFFSVWVILFSGLDNAPRTLLGRFFAMIVLGAGVGLAGLFTGTVASVLVESQLRRLDVSQFTMDDHLVLCNWGPRALAWIREVHSKIVQDKRPVVIIHDDTEQIELPDKQDDPAFNDVYIVKGDPTNEVVLRRARVPTAHSVVILADERQGEYADGKSILSCIAIRDISKGATQPNVAVECRNPENRHRLLRAGADEIISSDELGLRLLARTAIYHGMTRVYQELLTVGRDANEMYLFPVPEELVGRDFVEISSMFLRHRDDKRACLLIGLQRGEAMILNPFDGEAGPVKANDQLILLSRAFLHANQALPTVPPIIPSASTA
jgi:Trk K+ transport system NAD-binding subunit